LQMSNIMDLDPIEDGAYPPWRVGLEFRQGSGNPPWGTWLPFREGILPSLHGIRETVRAVRWITRPRWPGESLESAAYWSLVRLLSLPGRDEDPMLLPWEVQALHAFLAYEDHRGAAILHDGEPHPLEGWDEVESNYVYLVGGTLAWIAPPARVPCVEVSEVRAPPPVRLCPGVWPFRSGVGRPPWWEPARRRTNFPPPPRAAPPPRAGVQVTVQPLFARPRLPHPQPHLLRPLPPLPPLTPATPIVSRPRLRRPIEPVPEGEPWVVPDLLPRPGQSLPGKVGDPGHICRGRGRGRGHGGQGSRQEPESVPGSRPGIQRIPRYEQEPWVTPPGGVGSGWEMALEAMEEEREAARAAEREVEALKAMVELEEEVDSP